MNTHKRMNTVFALVKSILLMGLLLGMATTGYSEQSITYIYTDHLGSPIKAINPTTGETWTEDYQPYGTKRLNQDGDNSVGYTGHRHEKSLNVTYMQGRWYHPGMGRFLALDPVRFVEGNPASFNRYAYANNNPYKYVDPDGRFLQLAPYILRGLVVGGLGGAAICNSGTPCGEAWQGLGESLKEKFGNHAYNETADSNSEGNAQNSNDSDRGGKKAKDSGKNSRHGDGGRATDKAQDQIADLENQLEGASKKEKQKIKQKIKNIKRDAERKKKGEEHSRTKKR